MKKLTLAFLCLLSTTVFFNSCKKENSPTGSGTGLPKAGSKWTYRQTDLNEDGSTASVTEFHATASDETVQGSAWIKLTRDEDGATILYLQKRSDGWWRMNPGQNIAHLWLKSPATVGDTYAIIVSDGSTQTANVLGTNESITVAAGTISGCLKVREDDSNSMENIDYMNAEKGMFIYTEEYDDHTNGTPGMFIDFKVELVSYTP